MVRSMNDSDFDESTIHLMSFQRCVTHKEPSYNGAVRYTIHLAHIGCAPSPSSYGHYDDITIAHVPDLGIYEIAHVQIKEQVFDKSQNEFTVTEFQADGGTNLRIKLLPSKKPKDLRDIYIILIATLTSVNTDFDKWQSALTTDGAYTISYDNMAKWRHKNSLGHHHKIPIIWRDGIKSIRVVDVPDEIIEIKFVVTSDNLPFNTLFKKVVDHRTETGDYEWTDIIEPLDKFYVYLTESACL